ncbi:MAG: hypothetical protein BWY11_02420 [Firmicutes bacterium ADurb.Bin182]|nr:MAG: hypothetical protein BWY11_02420 [Firmicutes bacterium ADurb.Bin182]
MHRDAYCRYARPRRSCKPIRDKRFLLTWGAIIAALAVLLICAPSWLLVLISCAVICLMYFYFTKWKK